MNPTKTWFGLENDPTRGGYIVLSLLFLFLIL